MRKIFTQTRNSSLSPWQVFQNLTGPSRKCFFLDSALRSPSRGSAHGKAGAFSYLGSNPFLEVIVKKNRVHVTGLETSVFPVSKLFSVLRRLFKKYRAVREPEHRFFNGGAVGFMGYEMARYFEKIRFRSKPSAGTPDFYLAFYSELIAYDHTNKKYVLIVRAQNSESSRLKFQKLERAFQSAVHSEKAFRVGGFKPEIPKNRFEAMVRRARQYIQAGDIYQANLSQGFSFSFKGSDTGLYEKLRRINPSPFASFLRAGELSIVSSSPERLVSKKGKHCETRPIAGTRPRRPGLEKKLLASSKERAEHIMLLDLERNDLGRVCDYRSVRVTEMMGIEKYSHVIHIVSAVTGRLSKGKDGWDLVRAMFPGGTITGCPKVRCMEIIDELERSRRGLYTGSIGYFGFNGDLDLNIIIRTLVLQGGQGRLQAGAGIVYDSVPSREYQETLHKGRALVQALGVGRVKK